MACIRDMPFVVRCKFVEGERKEDCCYRCRTFECGRLLKNPVLADMLGCSSSSSSHS